MHSFTLEAKSRKYRGVFRVKSVVKTRRVREIWSRDWSTSKSQKGGRNKVFERVSVPCWHATPVANTFWKPHSTINKINKLLPFAKTQGHWNLIKVIVDLTCSVNNASRWFMPMLAFVIRPCAFPNIIPHIIWRGHHINLLIWALQFIWHKGPVHQCYLANILRQYKQRRVMMTFCKRVYNWLFGNSMVYELINDERHGVLCK